jgi:hypothetical protein
MALTGNIESFPVAEVLRLAARSRQSGVLRVEAGGVQGRIYFSGGQLTYATSRDDDSLSDDLAAAGLIDAHLWYPVERGEAPIQSALAEGASPVALRNFLSDRIADVLVRIMRSRHGHFDFTDGASGRYEIGDGFAVEETLLGVERRVTEWAQIEAIIPSVNATIALAPHLGERAEVSINADTWRVLAAIGGSSTVWSIADSLGLSEFVAAKTMADLVRKGLVVVTGSEKSVQQPMEDIPRAVPAGGHPLHEPDPQDALREFLADDSGGDDDSVIDFASRTNIDRNAQGW